MKTFILTCNPIIAAYKVAIEPQDTTKEQMRDLGFRWEPESLMTGQGQIIGRWEWHTNYPRPARDISEQEAATAALAMWDKLVAAGFTARGRIAGLQIRALAEQLKPA